MRYKHCAPAAMSLWGMIVLNIRVIKSSLSLLIFLFLAGSVWAESTPAESENLTIAGTPATGKVNPFTRMFSGDIFANFRQMELFVPTREVAASSELVPWPRELSQLEFSGKFLGEQTGLASFLALSNTSSFLVIKDGVMIYEYYAHGDTEASQHISFSMAKSVVSALLGVALADGHIRSLDAPVREYLPELASPTFDGVTIKHVLQMSSGVRFDEDYGDPASDINKMTDLVQQMSYLEYINTLGRDHEPGTYNHYASINTQLLGILLVRTTGKSLTEYTGEKLWQPMGMEQPGRWMLDFQGFELAMGGLAASARDYARLGQLYLQQGRWGDKQLLPASWVTASVTPDEPHLMPGPNSNSSNVSGYQYQWWTPRNPDRGDFLARGIWGQTIYVHPANRVVIVKLAADRGNFQKDRKLAYIDYIQALAVSLAD